MLSEAGLENWEDWKQFRQIFLGSFFAFGLAWNGRLWIQI